MKKLSILLYAGLACTLPACETILPVDVAEDEEWGITLNAVASPDTTFWAYVTHCYPNSDAPDYAYKNSVYENFWEPDPYSDYYSSMLYSYYNDNEEGVPPFNNNKGYNLIKESVLTDATVELTVNGNSTYPMVYDTLMLCFQSNYTPVIGDRLEVRISNASGEQTIARTEVPRPQQLDVVETSIELLEKEENLYEQGLGANRGYVRMKLRLHDPAGEKNYYRLVVRGSIGSDKFYGNGVNSVWDPYLSSDPIFRDDRLISEWGAWPSFFSNVFDDTLMNGESYEFDVKTYILGFTWMEDYWPYYEVSLQSITEDYYRYLKSMQLYRISRTDTYSEGVYIHSNNEGGWGMLGGISGEVHRVEPFKDYRE